MKKKIKLFATVATLCLSLAMMAFGVFSALTVTYKTTGTISYDIEDTYVEIETRVYSTSKKYDDEATLKAKSQEFETSTFTTLDTLTTTGLVEGETTHDFNKVQIKNLDQGEDYTVQESDYKDTYSSVTATEAPEDLEVALKYQTAQGEGKGVYTYFVVTKLTNKSALQLYVSVPTEGDDKYVAPTNSYTYKQESFRTISALNDELYVVFSMSLNDITVAIDASAFTFPITVTKDEPIASEVKFNLNNTTIANKNIWTATSLSTIIESLELEYDEYNSCGWFYDSNLTKVANLSDTIAVSTNLYTKEATLDDLDFGVVDNAQTLSAKVTSAQAITYDGTATASLKTDSENTDIVLPVAYRLEDKTYQVTNWATNTNLTSIVIPTGFTQIAENTFKDCSSLYDINLHSNLLTIEAYAFSRCGPMAIKIPASVTEIKSHAFYDCKEYYYYQDEFNSYCYEDTYIGSSFEFEAESKLTTIGEYAFADCALSSITIPKSVKTIEDSAFAINGHWVQASFDYGDSGHYESTSEIQIEQNSLLETIGDDAFYGTNLREFTIPKNVKSIGKGAFSKNCSVIVWEMFDSIQNDHYGTCIKFEEGFSMDTIPEEAFSETYIEYIEIPASVKIIGKNAFSNCTIDIPGFSIGTESITFAEGSQLTEIQDGAFKNQVSLLNIELPETLTTIGVSAFEGCTNLIDVVYKGAKSDLTISEGNDTLSSKITYLYNGWIETSKIVSTCTTSGSATYEKDGKTETITLPLEKHSFVDNTCSKCNQTVEITLSSTDCIESDGVYSGYGVGTEATISVNQSCVLVLQFINDVYDGVSSYGTDIICRNGSVIIKGFSWESNTYEIYLTKDDNISLSIGSSDMSIEFTVTCK